MDKKAVNIIKYTVSAVIAALCIWMVVRKVEWASFWQGLQSTRWGWMILFVVASLLAIVFRTERWRELLLPLEPGTKRIDTWDALNIGNLANIALPGAGELLRCGLVTTGKATYDKSLGAIVMERAWDVLAIIVVFVLSLTLKWDTFSPFVQEHLEQPFREGHDFSLLPLVILVIAVLAAAIWAVFHFRERSRFCGRIAGALGGVVQGVGSFLKVRRKLRFALLTVLIWLSYILMSWFGIQAVPALSGLTFTDALFISAVGNFASVIPVPSGMGPYHYLMMVTFSFLYGFPDDTGLLYAVLCHEGHAIVIILIGVISYLCFSLRKKK